MDSKSLGSQLDATIKLVRRHERAYFAYMLLSPEAIEAAEKAVHRNRGLDGSGEKAIRAALEVALRHDRS